MPTFRGQGYVLKFPDYRPLVRQVFKAFLPDAGKYLVGKMRDKIGTYQTGWAPLADSTKARKSRMLGRSRKRRQTRMGWGPDTPLLDTGQMRNSFRFGMLKGQSIEVTADFPMGQHEQDPLVAQFGMPIGNILPARPVMGPALDAALDPLADKLESIAGAML
jgi:hypothetical protein